MGSVEDIYAIERRFERRCSNLEGAVRDLTSRLSRVERSLVASGRGPDLDPIASKPQFPPASLEAVDGYEKHMIEIWGADNPYVLKVTIPKCAEARKEIRARQDRTPYSDRFAEAGAGRVAADIDSHVAAEKSTSPALWLRLQAVILAHDAQSIQIETERGRATLAPSEVRVLFRAPSGLAEIDIDSDAARRAGLV